MSDDLLERATRALREESREPQLRSGLTRARILESAEKRSTSRRASFGLRWVIAIVAALGASTALARVAQYWPEIKRTLMPASAPAEVPSSAPRREKPRRPQPAAEPLAPAVQPQLAPPPTAAPEPQAVPALPAPAAEQPLARAGAPRGSARSSRPSPTQRARKGASSPDRSAAPAAPEAVAKAPLEVAPASVAKPAAESAELALFRRAERLHRAQDPRALGAWNDYLRVASQGVLVPEARYNRALCLVRLGRRAEAREALQPFASGVYAGYRQSEARELLEALQR